MNESLVSFIGGLLSAAVALGIHYYADADRHALAKHAVAAIEQCEAELPRNQHCTIVAIPEEKE